MASAGGNNNAGGSSTGNNGSGNGSKPERGGGPGSGGTAPGSRSNSRQGLYGPGTDRGDRGQQPSLERTDSQMGYRSESGCSACGPTGGCTHSR